MMSTKGTRGRIAKWLCHFWTGLPPTVPQEHWQC